MQVERPDVPSGYDDLMRRKELISRIEQLIQTPATQPPARGHLRAVLDLPRIVVMDRRVVCDGRMLDLARRPLTLRLFQLFVAADKEVIQRDDLVAALYDTQALERSDRFAQSLLGNAIKLVSRSRALAAAFLTGPEHVGLEWFPYDPERKCWSLYRLHHRYWLDRLS